MEEKVFITTMSDTIYGVSIGIKRTQKVHNNGLIRHQLCRSTMDIIYQRTPNSIYIPTGAILTSSMVYEVAVLRTEKQWHSNCPVNFDSNRALNTGMPLRKSSQMPVRSQLTFHEIVLGYLEKLSREASMQEAREFAMSMNTMLKDSISKQ